MDEKKQVSIKVIKGSLLHDSGSYGTGCPRGDTIHHFPLDQAKVFVDAGIAVIVTPGFNPPKGSGAKLPDPKTGEVSPSAVSASALPEFPLDEHGRPAVTGKKGKGKE